MRAAYRLALKLKDSHLASAVCCEESCRLITVWSCKRQQTGVLSGQLIIGREECGNGILPPEEHSVPTHSFVHRRAERHPRFGARICVIEKCMCIHTHTHRATSEFALRFTTIHLSQRQDSKMTRLTARWLVSDIRYFCGPNLGPLNSLVFVGILP